MFKAEVYRWLLLPGDHTTPMKTVVPLNRPIPSFKVYLWEGPEYLQEILDVLRS